MKYCFFLHKMYYLHLSSHSELDSESIIFSQVVLFLSLYLRGKEKEKERKRKRKDALFSTSSLRSAVFFFRLKPNPFLFAIVLRTRSQLAEHCLKGAALSLRG